ncbi:hypothetical protein AAMO2058_000228000 [Amorphochlora amoebiformis]|eukprot:1369800-Amorphochlora_amoeboformis.AAC.2
MAAQLQLGVKRLYRKMIKSLPGVMEQYEFTTLQENDCKRLLKKHFSKYYAESNPAVIEMLTVKGKMELDETLNMHKTPCHILKLLTTDIEKPERMEDEIAKLEYMKLAQGSEFMAAFYQGK